MSSTPTAQQIADLRADMGVDSSIFSDTEVTQIWSRVSGARDELLQHEAALALMCRQMLANSAKLHNYSVAGDSNSLSQVFDHFEKMYKMYEPTLRAALGSRRSIALGALRPVEDEDRETPNE